MAVRWPVTNVALPAAGLMALDVNTPRGQETVAEEQACARLFERHHPGVQYIGTPKDSACRVDAILSTSQRMLAAVEQKSRFDVTLSEFKTPAPRGYGNEWLVTYDKLVAARAYAKDYSMPLYGFLWIVKDRTLMVQRITDRVGNWVAKFRVARTKTQATVNGGQAVRDNAFIDMAGCRVYRDKAPTQQQAAAAAALAPKHPPKPDQPLPLPTAGQTVADWLSEYDSAGTREWGAQW